MITARRTGTVEQNFELAEAAAVARTAGMLYNLPNAIKAVAEELDRRKLYVDKMKNQEANAGATTERAHFASVGTPVPVERSYADKLDSQNRKEE